MKQSAVEWLFNQIAKDILGLEYDYADDLEKAKQMESEQKGYTEEQLYKILIDFSCFPHPHEEPRGSIAMRFIQSLKQSKQ